MDIFCSKTSCEKLPVHSHSSLNHHIFITEESLSGQALSHEILNILSVSRPEALQERLFLPHVSMTASLLANTLGTGAGMLNWKHEHSYSLEQRAEIPLLGGCNSPCLPWSAQRVELPTYTGLWVVLVNVLINCNIGIFFPVSEQLQMEQYMFKWKILSFFL